MLFSLFLDRAAGTYDREVQPPGPEFTAALMRHRWPGNVRELKNLAERYALSSRPEELALTGLFSSAGKGPDSASAPLSEQVQHFERQIIKDAIKRHQGDMKAVMEELGLPRRTLNEKMAKFGLSRNSNPAA